MQDTNNRKGEMPNAEYNINTQLRNTKKRGT